LSSQWRDSVVAVLLNSTQRSRDQWGSSVVSKRCLVRGGHTRLRSNNLKLRGWRRSLNHLTSSVFSFLKCQTTDSSEQWSTQVTRLIVLSPIVLYEGDDLDEENGSSHKTGNDDAGHKYCRVVRCNIKNKL